MTLFVYDLDKTLINGDSNELWHEYLLDLGILGKDFIKEDKRLMDLYAKGVLDMDEYLSFAIEALKVLDKRKIDRLMDDFLKIKIKPIIYEKTPSLISQSNNNIIISATPEFIVSPISKMLGIDECIGMRLIRKDGKFTGSYEKPLSYKEGKVECLKAWLKEKNLSPKKVVFYSDSINDLPLLEYAHEAFCVNPDEKLNTIAKQKGWTIYTWDR